MPPEPAERTPDADYRARGEAHAAAARAAGRRARRVGWARVAAFLGLVLAAAAAVDRGGSPGTLAAALGAAGLFLALVAASRRARDRARWHARLAEVCALGEARVLRGWDALPPPRVEVPAGHPHANDLHLAGRASLWQLVDTVSAYPGRDALAARLLGPPPNAEGIRARQAAARELAPMAEWREALAAHALDAGEARRQSLDAFLAWAAGAPGPLARRPAYAAVCLTPAACVAAALAAAVSPAARPAAGLVALTALGVNALLTAALRRQVAPAVRAATSWSAALRRHAALLGHAATLRPAAPELVRLTDALRAGGGASRAAARLDRVGAAGEARYSPMVYVAAQAALLWDAHVAAAAERWRRDAGARARGWLDALGELEALAALGTLAHDNPGWTFPEVREATREDATFDATALGHPLIAAAARVPNDVTVGPPGTALVVTGSNMAGKSTLLRAVGLNAVLAMAGGPVCARRLVTPRVRVMTSVAVRDSLAEDTSLFLAELRRVKEIVDAARDGAAPPVLYLLDEVLHGTNSAERRVATRAVIARLLAARAIGAVSTHDLALPADEPLASAARLVHFTETVHDGADGGASGGARMTFDYRLRPGLATSTNALVLLRLMGLDGNAGSA